MNVKTTIRVNFIGESWMPAVTCASSLNLSDSDNAQFNEPYDLTDDAECLEFVKHCLGTRTGDFQSVSDFEAIKEVTTTIQQMDGEKRIVTTKTEFTTLKAWSNEENECVLFRLRLW